ncbi:unnamed protein product [Ilex paraguariensis]|uniref:Amidohydrolase 3 domain-containing protein n=1 Tax=Ilex paraguariensis TaxID=185542 RepID=A0ABC8TU75_9AQUA
MNSWVTLTASLVVLLSIASLPLLKNHYFLNWRPWWSSNSVVADLLVTNGTIYTSDDSLPFADSMAILNGRVLRVGNYSSLKDLAGYGTEELNLEGKVVVPGFIDSHVHLLSGGLQMAQVELRGMNRKDEFVIKVKEAVASKLSC